MNAPPTYEENVQAIADNISRLAGAVEALLKGPLKRRTLVVLLASSSGHAQTTVDSVLRALENLRADWLK